MSGMRFLGTFIRIIYAVFLALFISPVAIALPLTTEDSGTLGKSRLKIELNGESSEVQTSGSKETSVTREASIIYGLGDNLNGFVGLPHREVSAQEADGSTRFYSGYADAKFGLKWRYFEQGGFSSGLKGTISSPTGDAAKKLGYGRSTYGMNAISSYELEEWEVHMNLGYTLQPNSLDELERLVNLSAAVVYKFQGRWQMMADMGSTSSKGLNDSLGFFGLGLSYAIAKDIYAEIGWKHSASASTDEIGRLARLAVKFY